MIGQAYYACTQLDVLCALGGRGYEEFRRGDGLPSGAVVLPDPGLVEAQVVEPLQQLEVAFEAQGGVLAQPVKWP